MCVAFALADTTGIEQNLLTNRYVVVCDDLAPVDRNLAHVFPELGWSHDVEDQPERSRSVRATASPEPSAEIGTITRTGADGIGVCARAGAAIAIASRFAAASARRLREATVCITGDRRVAAGNALCAFERYASKNMMANGMVCTPLSYRRVGRLVCRHSAIAQLL